MASKTFVAIAFALFHASILMAQFPSGGRFEPNYVSTEAVELIDDTGRVIQELPAQTKVSAFMIPRANEMLRVTTSQGKHGLAVRSSFALLVNGHAIDEQTQAAASAHNQFAIDLYQQLREKEKNLFFSPVSIFSGLSIALEGASEKTKAEMTGVLHLNDKDITDRAISQIQSRIRDNNPSQGYLLHSANRLFVRSDIELEPAFVEQTRKNFDSEVTPLDFSRPDIVSETVNLWVSTQTKGAIPRIVTADDVSAWQHLIIVNAIHFQGKWEYKFNQDKTRQVPFFWERTRTVKIEMMRQEEELPYTETDLAQIVELPYLGGQLGLLVVLPKSGDGLDRVEAELTHETFQEWTEELSDSIQVDLRLPKFEIDESYALDQTLSELGMPDAFSNFFAFPGISKASPLVIDSVRHRATVKLDEEGTEMAAVSTIDGAVGGGPGFDEKVQFIANHPFMFMLYDKPTKTILFMGRMRKP